MGDVLAVAAKECQIFIFTCVSESAGVKGQARTFEEEKYIAHARSFLPGKAPGKFSEGLDTTRMCRDEGMK
jgi:hypothetical protein